MIYNNDSNGNIMMIMMVILIMIINNNSNSNIYSNFNPTTHHRTTALPWSIGTHHRCTGAPPERPGAHRNLRNLQNSHVEKKNQKIIPNFHQFSHLWISGGSKLVEIWISFIPDHPPKNYENSWCFAARAPAQRTGWAHLLSSEDQAPWKILKEMRQNWGLVWSLKGVNKCKWMVFIWVVSSCKQL